MIHACSSAKRINTTIHCIRRFIEEIPEGTTVDEIRYRLDMIEPEDES